MKRIEDMWLAQRLAEVRRTYPTLNRLNDYELVKIVSKQGLCPLQIEDFGKNSLKIRVKKIAQEHDLRNGIYEFLKTHKLSAAKEKSCCNGLYFADLVTDQAVIECKYILSRHSLHMARGQAQTYAHDLKKSKIVIAGLAPSPYTLQSNQSRRLIEIFRRQGIEVWEFHIDGEGAICKIDQITLNIL